MIIFIFWLIMIAIGVPSLLSLLAGLLLALLAKGCTRKTIFWISALTPSAMLVLCGTALISATINAESGGAPFVAYAVLVFGYWAIVPGMIAGYLVARHLRPE